MDDLISRQAAIDAITEIDGGLKMDIFTSEVKELLRELPSAEPELLEVIRDIATIIENEKDMRVIAQQARKEVE